MLDLIGLFVAVLVPAVLPLVEKLRPGLFGFADENNVRQVAEIGLAHGDPRPADNDERAAFLQFDEDLAHPRPLNDHPGERRRCPPWRRDRSRVSSTHSSTSSTVCSGGVRAASSGKQPTGMFARLRKIGSACSRPQYEVSKRGLMSTMFAKVHLEDG